MKAVAGLILLALSVSACATQRPVSVLPIAPVDPVVTPVSFADLRGQSVMVLDRTEPQVAVRRITTYLRQCKDGTIAFDRNGLRLLDRAGSERLSLMVAERGPVTGIALDGPDYSPALQDELADAAQGASRCAAA